MRNLAVWFDIPVADLERAMAFYSKIFQVELQVMPDAPKPYAMFPFAAGEVSEGNLMALHSQN